MPANFGRESRAEPRRRGAPVPQAGHHAADDDDQGLRRPADDAQDEPAVKANQEAAQAPVRKPHRGYGRVLDHSPPQLCDTTNEPALVVQNLLATVPQDVQPAGPLADPPAQPALHLQAVQQGFHPGGQPRPPREEGRLPEALWNLSRARHGYFKFRI